ncbi:ABC transporter permease DevC [Anabaena sp. FACHB-709]|uniref:Heterocyst specific ABC-transporter, membrane spanning subunit DevC homolog n=2 Tax=Nostocaceae TaxID=1162 RepID=A0A1Z4KNK2_ANAVA|nr:MULTISPECIES: ABC transporter permease DevC [Nostocaceae]BAY70580.1 heterocyst specific ABC-transporter, membrane spanning subunit DevC homolog [Trichormus variabilis NIES-23]HBW29070.1 ABC transporter permease [Nostoc sp. UBA8866]MBD2173288.1 FtsX-like permease family protein [Anabaena cylindrica FACHB-318]MBD2265039.1 FtsX-like permease family protein [Anabaena sp. FACHB-709]MBD2274349.1 FtsX-like permease family protein [Nostoc sp. PCC 7120 = FACHB-418]
MKRKIPLAWLQLSREKARMVVAIAGIAFADVLMFLQLGIREALFDGAVQLHNSLEGEIVLVSSRYKSLFSQQRFSQRRLYQAMGFTGVQSVSPIYVDPIPWKNPDNQETWNIYVIAFNPEEKVLNLAGVQENLTKLREPDTVLFDLGSRKEFGQIVSKFQTSGTFTTEINNRQIKTVGLFKLGTSFGINGNLITSDVNFFRLFNQRRQPGLIDLGLIKLESGADINWVLANLKANLPDDINILTKQEFADQEKSYWNSSTPVGFTFTLGVIIGFMVGAVIVYQILYSDVSDHLPEYATLKAIGFKNRYLLIIVFQEALILAAIGFIPGIAISQGLYMITRQATLLPIMMTLDRAVLIFMLTTLMCSISASLAIRKLQAADPADIF